MPKRAFNCPGCGKNGLWAREACRRCMNNLSVNKDPKHTPSSDPSWRPRHYPPACTRCNGFAFIQHGGHSAWSTCPSCRTNPGHAVSFNEWNQRA